MSNIVPKRGVIVKRILSIAAFIAIMIFTIVNVNAAQIYYNDEYHDYDAGIIKLNVGGKELTALPMYPVIIDDYTMVPVREVFEAMGSQIIWHDDTCRVEIKNGDTSVFVKIGDRNTYINGEIVPIDSKQPLPMLIGQGPEGLKSMVPVRFVAEKLGFLVDWDDKTRTVYIDKKNDSSSEIIGGVKDEVEEVIPEEKGLFGSVTAKSDEKYDYIYVGAKYGVSPKISRYSNPDRIVFDFPDSKFTTLGGTLQVGGKCVESVRYSNHETHARLVLDIIKDSQPMIMSSEKGILIRVENSPNTQIIYDAFSDRVYFDKSYVGKGKPVDNGYSVTFTSIKMVNQKIEIHDKNIYEIIISNSPSGCNVKVDGSKKLTYTAEKGFYKSDSVINDVKPDVNVSGKKLVVIDAGHGGEDPGAVGYNSSGNAVAYESHINLAISLLVGEKLEKDGINVVYTRDKDKYITLQERSELANEIECDMFVSIHCNSIENAQINGTQVYYHPDSEIGTVLAENIYNNMVEMTSLSPKETQNGSHLYVIRTTTSPAVLVETAFISNESDRNYLLSKSGQETMAEAIYRGIIQTMNE